jgi:hypothetical protein
VTWAIHYSNAKVYLQWSSESSAIKLKDNNYLHTIHKYHLWRTIWKNSTAEAVAFLRRSAAFVSSLLRTFRDIFRGQAREAAPPSPQPITEDGTDRQSLKFGNQPTLLSSAEERRLQSNCFWTLKSHKINSQPSNSFIPFAFLLNFLAPELFFLILAHLYIKCE